MSIFNTLFGFEPTRKISKDKYQASGSKFDDHLSEIIVPKGGMLSKEATALLSKILIDHSQLKELDQQGLIKKPVFALRVALNVEGDEYIITQRNEKNGYGYSLAVFHNAEKKDVRTLKELFQEYRYKE